jgi:hypothetical protein
MWVGQREGPIVSFAFVCVERTDGVSGTGGRSSSCGRCDFSSFLENFLRRVILGRYANGREKQ